MLRTTTKKFAKLFLLSLMVCVLIANVSRAILPENEIDRQSSKTKVKIAESKTCITSECHQELSKERYVHPNIKEKKCVICHAPTKGCTEYQDGKKHTFTLKGEDAELCIPCHKMGEKEYVHETIKKGICLECHNAHQSQYSQLLKSSPIATICLKCHVKGIFKGKTIHGPVALGHCNICHEPHESYYEGLTRGEATEECFKCHEKERKEFSKEYVHKPVREDCNNCHDPHASSELSRLKLPPPDNCYDCHKEQKNFIESVSVKHDAITEDEFCLNCHTPHASNLPKQLIEAPMELCLTCHNKDLDTPYGSIRNMVTFLDDNSYVHGPIKRGDCSACHNPHGSDYWRMIKQYFPQEFYAPFTLGMYELCFGCHDKTRALTEETTTITGFRNGEENLHHIHVNKKEKGRTCKACHDIHASNNLMHIAYDFPYGQWLLPINYEPLEEGGRCSPGCHETKEYNRTAPIDNKSLLLDKYGKK